MKDEKIAWITGASSGIGHALAVALAQAGWSLIISGRRVAALDAVAAALPTSALTLPFEATDFDALPRIAERALAWRGHVDLLVNNAGVTQRSLALDTGFDVYRRLMEVDFFAPLRLTQLILPHMVARRSGHLVAISSLAGMFGSPLRTGYCAAKHALNGYFEALRAEIELAHGISVSIVMPGSVSTDVATNALKGDGSRRGSSDDHIDNGMDPADAAAIIFQGIAEGCREIIVAEGRELRAAELRHTNPARLFKAMSAEGARLDALRLRI